MALGLKFISGKYLGGELVLPEEGELFIGRATELDLVLAEDMVSRKHAKLCMHAGALEITDLGSTNGTFVNGEKITRADLGLHDRVLIGTSILRVVSLSELSTTSGERGDVKAMMERLAAREGDSSTMSGELADVPLPDLLQLFSTNQKSGVLTISGDTLVARGKIFIKDGKLTYAAIAGEPPMSPMKALCRMLTWEGGAFVLDPYEDLGDLPQTFTDSTEGLLIEALRQLDELRRLLPSAPRPVAPLRLVMPLGPKLSALSPAELDVLQLALNFVTVKAVVDRFPGTDYEAYAGLQKLIRNGYLEAG